MNDNKISISVIIPCKEKDKNLEGLLKDILNQKTSTDVEIIEIPGVTPAGKARNLGAEKAKGDILVFVDADICLGNEFILEKLVEVLLNDKSIGVAASSIKIPEDATNFERWYAREIPHCESPIVNKVVDVWVATSACCAVWKDVFFKIGKFNAEIPRGQDPEFSYRLRKAGYRTVLAPQVWCYHRQPQSISELIRIHFRNGRGAAFVDTFYPELNVDIHPKSVIYTSSRKSQIYRVVRFCFQLIDSSLKCKFLLILAKLIYAFGYVCGILKFRIKFL